MVAERCSLLAARLFKAAGTAGIAADLPFGRILADITVGRQHISNQFEIAGRSYGAFLFGIENNKDSRCSGHSNPAAGRAITVHHAPRAPLGDDNNEALPVRR